jgi:DNA-binding response OmpR family regulator
MRGIQAKRPDRVVQFGKISLDFGKMSLSRTGQPVGITACEFKVLKFPISRPEIVVSRRRLIRAVFPARRRSTYRTVRQIAQKVESDPGQPIYIRTFYGVGYRFVPQEPAARGSGPLSREAPKET